MSVRLASVSLSLMQKEYDVLASCRSRKILKRYQIYVSMLLISFE